MSYNIVSTVRNINNILLIDTTLTKQLIQNRTDENNLIYVVVLANENISKTPLK